MSPRVFIVIPVHNRRAITLACLRRLRDHQVFTWATPIVVDDGSTDGTDAAVKAEFPEARLLHGDGQLFWTGAIEFGMRHAVQEKADYIFWLNDDCEPRPGALAQLLAAAQRLKGVTGGVCMLPESEFAFYGGFRKVRRDLEFVSCASGEERACDALNGNLVCMPRTLIEAIGYPDAKGLPHGLADTDYTLRAREAGWSVTLIGDARADATPNRLENHASWLVSDISLGRIWGSLIDRRSYAYFPAQLRFLSRHWGLAGTARCFWLLVKRIPFTLLILTVPLRVRRKWWGARSRAWRYEQTVRAHLKHG